MEKKVNYIVLTSNGYDTWTKEEFETEEKAIEAVLDSYTTVEIYKVIPTKLMLKEL